MGFLRARTRLFLGHGRQPGVKRFLLKHELNDNVVLQGIRAPLKTVSWNLFLLHNEAGKKLPAAAFHTEAWERQKETFFLGCHLKMNIYAVVTILRLSHLFCIRQCC